MQGVGGRAAGGNYIVALDANTGEEAWRFYTIARPGEPGGDSWNGLPRKAQRRFGVDRRQLRSGIELGIFRVGQTMTPGRCSIP